MNIQELITKYLSKAHVMQVATASSKGPWNCTVYYVADGTDLYWASLPTRRHSQEIVDNSQVAATIVIKSDIGKSVIGLQISGRAEMVTETKKVESIANVYAERFGRDENWVEEFSAGKTKHRLYMLIPDFITLFDEEHFSGDDAQQTWQLK